MTTYFTDTFTGTDGTAISSTNWTSIFSTTGASATIQSNKGRWNAGTGTGYTGKKSMRYATSAIIDQEWIGKVTFPASNDGTFEGWVRAQSGSFDGNGYFLSAAPGGTAYQLYKASGYTYTVLGTYTMTISRSVEYGFRIYAVGTSIKTKLWLTSGSEPAYQISVTDSSISTAGYPYLSLGGGNSASMTVDFDDVSLTNGSGGATATLTGTAGSSGAISRVVTKSAFTASVATSGVYSGIRIALRVFTATLPAAGTLTRQARKAFSGTLPAAGTLTRQARKAFAGSAASAGSFGKSMIRIFVGAVAPAGNLVTEFLGRALGKPGIVAIVANFAGEVRLRVRGN